MFQFRTRARFPSASGYRAPVRTIAAMWQSAISAPWSHPAFLDRAGDGSWRAVTASEAGRRVDELAAGLIALGLEKGDRVGILSRTRLEWTLCDYALASIGCVSVPVYATSSAPEIAHVLADAGARAVLCEDQEQYAKLAQVRGGLPDLEQVVVFDGSPGSALPLAGMVEDGRRLTVDGADPVGGRRASIGEEDVLTIIYTSGTTGPPKGCVLLHRQFWQMAEMVKSVPGLFAEHDRVLLYLPLAHNFARLVQFAGAAAGFTLAFCPDVSLVAQSLQEVRPTIFPSVPRVFEKMYDVARARLDEATGLRRRIARRAVAVGAKVAAQQADGMGLSPALEVQRALADRLVYRKVRALLGGELRLAVSGGAPLSPEIAEFFASLGILILEGYGLTECTTASHLNWPRRYRFGTVGLPLPGVETRAADDGEILLRSETVFVGYHGDPAATAAVVDAEGWLHTGDIGSLDADGFLTITDRKKDIIVTSGGKNVSPQNIENALRSTPAIAQALVIGDRRPYLTALVVPAQATAGTREELEALVEQGVADVNRGLGRIEQIKRFAVLERDFSADLGEVTPTLKLRRHVCEEHFRDVIASLYAQMPPDPTPV